MGATRVLLAVLCTKVHDRRAHGIEADFNGVDLPDRYVFGYGMDYHEQARNLPAIYALKD
jgi:hypoxanthine phosphoribosyltransferase